MMQDDYYVLFNDKKSPYQHVFLPGILSTLPGNEPQTSKLSFPYDVPQMAQEKLYFNFNESLPLRFDYREHRGHIVSPAVLEVLEHLKLAPHYKKHLTIYMKGMATDHDYWYLAFDRGSWDKGVQQNPERVFFDEENSDTQLDRDGWPLPTGHIALTTEAVKYDVFQLINIGCINSYMVCSADAKAKLEAVGIKGARFVPLQQAFAVYLKDEINRDLSELLPKVKKVAKPWFADVGKKSE
ncbi:Imm43 family immunity protein [Shewanella sedimentimangrovi]|uniref:Immunity protein 43 domain-containing protein n=1 Tax=Shewanella sedimentimangrovi TaxID=2814293 RepID=A0ABX7R407_9GAMM|nr:Imm43 family immunity protein [Shewanella sedimentimangrovi]QSX37550.1 hypothetical protein JYB85_01510 [Shewanella sedimentimangrovi]